MNWMVNDWVVARSRPMDWAARPGMLSMMMFVSVMFGGELQI